MTVSDVIKYLTAILDEHGDAEIESITYERARNSSTISVDIFLDDEGIGQ